MLMLLLAGMEGLEVAVIDRWSHLYPERPTSDLAAWLAARQLFVALIVTAATLLADRDSLAIPFVATPFTGAVALKIFNLVFTTLTVLWFMQIFPKHMAAMNADRYLKVFRAALFPVVEFVRVIGISWPGREDRPGRSEPARLARRADPREGTIAARRVPGQSLGRSDPVARARDPAVARRSHCRAYWKLTPPFASSGSPISIHSGTA